MKYLLDTNAMTAWAKRDAHFIARIQTSVPSDLRISVMTEHELRYGIACNPNLRLRPVLERMLTLLQKVMVDSMPIRLTPKDTIGGSFTRRQTLPVVAAPSFWALTG